MLVTSTLTRDEQDDELRKQLLSKPNIRIIDEYVPSIQEIYQMSDLYFFPVKESGNCIDVPLSCMEAAACNKPILTTDYGEMKELIGNTGIFKIESFESETLNHQVNQVLGDCNLDIRTAVLPYDWNNAVRKFL